MSALNRPPPRKHSGAYSAPGTRVVSHDWDMGDWRPDRSIEVDAPDKPVGLHKCSRIHLWIVPARVQGRWQGAITGPGIARELRLSLAQRFQDLAFEADSAAGRAGAHAGSVDGTRVRLTLQVDGRPVLLEGTFGGDAISGEASVDGRSARWRITRQGQDAR